MSYIILGFSWNWSGYLAFAGLPDYNLDMKESGKKAYEIAYALWRVAAGASEGAFADILRNKAIELVGLAADENYARLNAVGDSLNGIIKFAVDVNCISITNAAILVREIGNLQSAIPVGSANNFADINIADIFSDSAQKSEQSPRDDFAAMEIGNPENGKKVEARQSAILEKIMAIGNCRLSDIQAILPDTSERTLRYDLESLVQRNLIERIGTGGRSVYYRLRPIVNEA